MNPVRPRPNFIFILADDLGHADLGCYGGRAPVSPHLDAMAAQGLRFTRGYANAPVCSPTRFALATGRWQYRLRGAAEEPIAGNVVGDKVIGLPPAHPTLASLLREAGWRTAMMGKWHLGFPPHFGPLKSGFQEHFGPMSGGVDYHTHTDRSGKPDLWENGEPITQKGYLTDLISERSAAWIRRCAQAGEPFFLSVNYTAPHWPWETRDDEAVARSLTNIGHLEGGSVSIYQRMIHHMDEGIGQILQALRETGVDDNTLVVFSSDNGGERFSDNWPLVGGKMDLTEGGVRVPLIARWPAVIAPGGTSAQPAITMDWVATMLEAAGVAASPEFPLDGESLMPVLRDPAWRAPRTLYWRMKHRAQRAVSDGSLKWLKVDDHEYLFNLDADERERANLIRQQPALAARLKAQWEAWDATLPPIPDDARVSLIYTDADMPAR